MKNKKAIKNKGKKRMVVFGTAGVFLSLAFFVFQANAGTEHSVTEWLWGGSEDANIGGSIGLRDGNETGVGWVSLNNINTEAGKTGVNYGVQIPEGDGPVSGYAWSPNIGWISFFPVHLTGCPQEPCNARRIGNNLEGWARIMAIRNASEAGNSGGWRGWIKLGGNNYGVRIQGENVVGYGWNGETAGSGRNMANGLGWIKFDGKIALPLGVQALPDERPVRPGATVNLNCNVTGKGSSVLSYQWRRTAGPAVSINNAQNCNASFTASSNENVRHEFVLEVTDGKRSASDSASVFTRNIIPDPVCGDGNLDSPGEKCDDGNTLDGDGCDSNCQLEETGAEGPWREVLP